MNKVDLGGVFPPIPTPFGEDGEVAYGALAENLARWNAYELRGYIVLGSNGEGVLLDPEEKSRVWEAARRAIAPGRLMIAGTGGESTRGTIATTRRAADAGADAALVVTPSYYKGKMNAAALVAHYRAVADASPIPIMIYNLPGNTGVNVDAATVARIAEHPNVIGIKDTGGNITQLAETVHLAPATFQVLAGSANFLLAALAVGAVGGVLALANVAPDRSLELRRLFLEGRMEEAGALQRSVLALNAAVTSRFGIAGLKAALDMLGYYGGPVRSPLLPLTEAERATVRDIVRDAGLVKGGEVA
ncbi:MAG TPA: dihydrodipicolinate synthase family protein [Anaerolineae bacterium]|nr:dihydrodipicolinate synthase family protein [Anaerolineae bacterium]